MSDSRSSRIAGLYRLSVAERIRKLERSGWLSPNAARDLSSGGMTLSAQAADKMIENVIGVFGLPLAVAANFIVNNRECLVPLVVEEPSIVAALSSAAALARDSGGFQAVCDESLLIGQVHVTGIADIDVALTSLNASKESLLNEANAVHPRLLARGGGVREIEFRRLSLPDGVPLIAVHFFVDTCDAMGANLVNTLCETVAPAVEDLCGGDVVLRILSNLADRSLVTASVAYASEQLATVTMGGEQVRDRIVQANDIALSDPYRAATHNKGIMNGIDAVALATGNDWRAIEAGVHAFASRSGQYTALTRWSVGKGGELQGVIQVPLKPGVIGGTLRSNPAVALGLEIAGAESSLQLAELMAAVGLAQNFSALRALATEGIQKGHMRLHARSMAASSGVPHERIDDVVDTMIENGEIKAWNARKLLVELGGHDASLNTNIVSAAGKIILFGEHAVVYGRHALALPVPGAVRAIATQTTAACQLIVDDWQIDETFNRDSPNGISAAIGTILRALGVADMNVLIRATSLLPRGMGMGSSAAFSVVATRAIAKCFGISLDDRRVNEIAFECEKLAHGTPSGVDNTVACYGQPTLFRQAEKYTFEPLVLNAPPPLLIAFSHEIGRTDNMVAGVRARFENDPKQYGRIFDQMDDLSVQGATALQSQDYGKLGQMINVCHGLLNAIEVSTPEIENMLTIARSSGAVGAKLTGAGGGGAIVALCPGTVESVNAALQQAGYATMPLQASKES